MTVNRQGGVIVGSFGSYAESFLGYSWNIFVMLGSFLGYLGTVRYLMEVFQFFCCGHSRKVRCGRKTGASETTAGNVNESLELSEPTSM
jgi:hypothetical protein